MKFKAILVALSVTLLTAFSVSAAEEKSFSEADYATAYALLDAMEMEKTLNETIDQMLTMQLQANPELAQYREIFQKFFQKYMGFESLKPQYAELYLETFSTEEIEELTEFYQTELGKKVIQATPVLTMRGAAIGQQAVQSHMAELQAEIAAAAMGSQKK